MEEETYEINEDLDIAELAAIDVFEAIYELGGHILYDHYIQNRSVPFAAQQSVWLVASTMELFYIRHDVGELEIWEEMAEPTPCKIDPWMRNIIPVKTKYKEIEPEEPSAQSLVSVNQSTRSFRSSRSNYAKKVSPTKSTRGFQNLAISEEPKPVPIPNLYEETSEDEAENQMRELKARQIKRKKEEMEREKKRNEEDKAKEREYKKEAEGLKSKKFTYDYAGKIMVVSPLKFKTVNSYSTSILRYSVPETIVEEPVQPENTKRTGFTDFGNLKPLKTIPKKEQEWVRNVKSLSSPIFEAINLSLGVAIFDGDRSKHAISNSSTKLKTMSRKEYFGVTDRGNNAANTSDLQVIKAESSHSIPPSRQNSTMKLPAIKSHKDLLENVPDNEAPFENKEIPKFSDSATPKVIYSKSPKLYKVQKYDNLENTFEMTPIDKFNMEILKNKNWGLNPPFKGAKVPSKLPRRNKSPIKPWESYGNKLKKRNDNIFASAEELWELKKNSKARPKDRRFVEWLGQSHKKPLVSYGQSIVDYSTLASTEN